MKAKWLIGLVVSILVILFWFTSVNNELVSLDEQVNAAKSQVENVYQRRFDLIPNLVNTVKGYAKHEATVLQQVTEARAKVGGQINLNSPESIKQFEQNQAGLTSALSRLMVVVEKYPELKADKNFLELQSQLEGTENRIAVERKKMNETARDFNTYSRRFPQSIVAGFRGFGPKSYFESQAGAAQAPKVEF